ncbi:MAG: endonuclease [Actinomycetota bacterium]|jgi:endonuclease-8|nr:endonuclease [Actinomycetota bacterium]
MPEGNTVWLTARVLDKALTGHPLAVAELRIGDLATTDLTGRQVREVVARGKHLLIRLDNGMTLHNHLRMDGAWRVHPAGRPITDARDQVRVVLGTAAATAVGYRVHDVALLPTAAEDTVVGHLGPDLLGPDWDAAVATGRLAADPDRSIGEAILDQRNLAGAGNVYKAETCFLRGVSPWTPVGDVRDLRGLVDLVARLLQANRERYDHVTTGDARPGRRTWVYDRAGRPCLRCGAAVQVAWQGDSRRADAERISYWCPNCQPGPSPEQAQRGLHRGATPRPR